ncbi:MAG TPA: MbnP family protein, partial [Bacteroidia bacterium]|nr:MbnP family protein [Bacteroidia bacterium]
HNCSGAQSGALDPVNAMFWEWNTGYIFMKMEGKSPVSKSPGNLLEFHIGGYRTPYNCIRTVTLKLSQQLNITKNRTEALTIKTNLAELFKTPTTIDFSKLSSVTDFHNATTIADNYRDMFSIK